MTEPRTIEVDRNEVAHLRAIDRAVEIRRLQERIRRLEMARPWRPIDVSAKPIKVTLSPEDQRILDAMASEWSHDYPIYYSFSAIARDAEVPLHEVRRRVRRLARYGLCEHNIGLASEDGNFRGAGYGLTSQGFKIATEKESPDV